MRNEPWVWPEVGDAGTSGSEAVPLRSAQMMGEQKKRKKKKKPIKTTGAESCLNTETICTNVHPPPPTPHLSSGSPSLKTFNKYYNKRSIP